MAVFTVERTARKQHVCTHCLGQIETGQRHEAYSITPNSDLGNPKWLSGRRHLSMNDCYPERPI
jgi:hypothetical protein